MKYLALLALLVACGDSNSITGVDLTSPSELVGSYRLAVYNALPDGPNPGGSLSLNADSTFTLSVGGNSPWNAITSGDWTWTGGAGPESGNIVLLPSHINGSIQTSSNGLALHPPEGAPVLFFRKN